MSSNSNCSANESLDSKQAAARRRRSFAVEDFFVRAEVSPNTNITPPPCQSIPFRLSVLFQTSTASPDQRNGEPRVKTSPTDDRKNIRERSRKNVSVCGECLFLPTLRRDDLDFKPIRSRPHLHASLIDRHPKLNRTPKSPEGASIRGKRSHLAAKISEIWSGLMELGSRFSVSAKARFTCPARLSNCCAFLLHPKTEVHVVVKRHVARWVRAFSEL
ncbi:hypothetical protein CVT26_011634 [Gymnopilus dilepis]|uniref:Uncharacterized protein n=1 Tax=Gymnopilus dilepis TaxID=231916 RepID=A0A409YQN7_9AGAR|nr:hypothetical protein CVT26_011634 [Gymnopilus dilepis]